MGSLAVTQSLSDVKILLVGGFEFLGFVEICLGHTRRRDSRSFVEEVKHKGKASHCNRHREKTT
jgi:hypothetical protein